MHSDHRSIGELAYRLWQARGCPAGTAEKDWLEAERQLATAPAQSSAAGAVQSSAALDESLKDSFPASDPPASTQPDEPPANAEAKWKAAGLTRKNSARRGPARSN